MSFLDELRKITHPYADEDDYQNEYDDDETDTRNGRGSYEDRRPRAEERRVKALNPPRTTEQLRVTLVKPERFENAREIADHFKAHRTVVLNLESTPKEEANRLLDFLSGVAYDGDGNVQRIAAHTYLITPRHVDIEGDLLDELGGAKLYF